MKENSERSPVVLQSERIEAMARVLGSSILKRRHEMGLSQEELASRAELHRTYISDIERGARNISFKSLCRLAMALEMQSSTLVALTEGHTNTTTEEWDRIHVNH